MVYCKYGLLISIVFFISILGCFLVFIRCSIGLCKVWVDRYVQKVYFLFFRVEINSRYSIFRYLQSYIYLFRNLEIGMVSIFESFFFWDLKIMKIYIILFKISVLLFIVMGYQKLQFVYLVLDFFKFGDLQECVLGFRQGKFIR